MSRSNVPKHMHKSGPPFNIENQELKVMVNSWYLTSVTLFILTYYDKQKLL